VHFEALEQTLRLRLVSGPADKYFFLIIGSAPTPTVPTAARELQFNYNCYLLNSAELQLLQYLTVVHCVQLYRIPRT
jgi:hypothetical protein